MDSSPLLSVIVLNHSKRDKAIRCLQSVMALEWPKKEVLLVDNASTDDSVAAVSERFGGAVRILARTENDVAKARNQGISAARGEFLLTLDNDILLPDADLVGRAIEVFTRHPGVGLLTPKIASPEEPTKFQKEHWWHPFARETHEDEFFLTAYFPEAAAFFRADSISEAGGYDERFFMGFEQADLAIRLIRKGWGILYCPNLVCVEDDVRSEFVRERRKIHYYNLRNKLWTARKHYPFGAAVRYSISKILISLGRGIRYGYPDLVFSGALQGLFPPRSIRRERNPMSHDEWAAFESARQGRVIDRPGVE